MNRIKEAASAGRIAELVAAIRSSVEDPWKCTCGLLSLSELLFNAPTAKKLFYDADGMQLLLATLEKWSRHPHLGRDIVRYGLAILQQMATMMSSKTKKIKGRHKVEITGGLKKYNLRPIVFTYMKLYAKDHKTQEKGLAALGWLLVNASDIVKAECIEDGMLHWSDDCYKRFHSYHVGRYAKWVSEILRSGISAYKIRQEEKLEEAERQRLVQQLRKSM